MKKNVTLKLAQAGLIAALYIVLTQIATMLGLSSGAIQVRFSEALTILPYFVGAAVPGLFIGCFLSNILAGCVIWDIVFGSLATLLGALGTRALRKASPWLAPLPPILANVIVVPIVLIYAYNVEDAWLYLVATVGAGEVISCGILGMALLFALKPHANRIFNTER